MDLVNLVTSYTKSYDRWNAEHLVLNAELKQQKDVFKKGLAEVFGILPSQIEYIDNATIRVKSLHDKYSELDPVIKQLTDKGITFHRLNGENSIGIIIR